MLWMIATLVLFGYTIYSKYVNTKLLDYIEDQQYKIELRDYFIKLYETKIANQQEVEQALREKLNGSN